MTTHIFKRCSKLQTVDFSTQEVAVKKIPGISTPSETMVDVGAEKTGDVISLQLGMIGTPRGRPKAQRQTRLLCPKAFAWHIFQWVTILESHDAGWFKRGEPHHPES